MDDTFYAKIHIQLNGNTYEIDCRPSDAIALAVRVKVPIYAEETVLDKAGVALDKETNRPFAMGSDVNGEEKEQMTEEDLKKMSAFKEFIGGLDLEDFERKRS